MKQFKLIIKFQNSFTYLKVILSKFFPNSPLISSLIVIIINDNEIYPC